MGEVIKPLQETPVTSLRLLLCLQTREKTVGESMDHPTVLQVRSTHRFLLRLGTLSFIVQLLRRSSQIIHGLGFPSVRPNLEIKINLPIVGVDQENG